MTSFNILGIINNSLFFQLPYQVSKDYQKKWNTPSSPLKIVTLFVDDPKSTKFQFSWKSKENWIWIVQFIQWTVKLLNYIKNHRLCSFHEVENQISSFLILKSSWLKNLEIIESVFKLMILWVNLLEWLWNAGLITLTTQN